MIISFENIIVEYINNKIEYYITWKLFNAAK